jgi:hypothetical protein
VVLIHLGDAVSSDLLLFAISAEHVRDAAVLSGFEFLDSHVRQRGAAAERSLVFAAADGVRGGVSV